MMSDNMPKNCMLFIGVQYNTIFYVLRFENIVTG
jgi:hypothetical protein